MAWRSGVTARLRKTMVIQIGVALLLLGLLLLGLAIQRERRLLAATTREAGETVDSIEAGVRSLQTRLAELRRMDDVAALFADSEASTQRSGGRRRGRKRKRRSRP